MNNLLFYILNKSVEPLLTENDTIPQPLYDSIRKIEHIEEVIGMLSQLDNYMYNASSKRYIWYKKVKGAIRTRVVDKNTHIILADENFII